MSRDPDGVRARIHAVCPLTTHRAICLKEEETSPRLGTVGPAFPHHRKDSAACCPRLALKDARMRLWCGGSSPPLPHDNEEQLLSTGEASRRVCLSQEREVRAGFLPCLLPILSCCSSHSHTITPSAFFSAFPCNPGSPQTYGEQ